MTLPLVTADERARLLAHGAALAAGQRLDPLPVVRLFTPDAHVTWLLVSLDPADGDTAYGLIDLGIGMPELGMVKLSDLAGIVGRASCRCGGIGISRRCARYRSTSGWRRRTARSRTDENQRGLASRGAS
ncbi:lipoprotein [Pseudomonas aeruginosa]|nr:lipoprotein [Pseudomonas aeruginosa]